MTTAMEVLEDSPAVVDRLTATRFFEKHYEHGLRTTAQFVSRHGGTFEDAKDILHDALVVLYERSNADKPIGDESVYLIGIVKNLWFKKFSRSLSTLSIERYEFEDDVPTPTPHEQRLLALLERAGKKCLNLLTAVYFSGSGIAALKEKFGFASDHSASVQKYKCIEKLKNTVKENSLGYEDFLE